MAITSNGEEFSVSDVLLISMIELMRGRRDISLFSINSMAYRSQLSALTRFNRGYPHADAFEYLFARVAPLSFPLLYEAFIFDMAARVHGDADESALDRAFEGLLSHRQDNFSAKNLHLFSTAIKNFGRIAIPFPAKEHSLKKRIVYLSEHLELLPSAFVLHSKLFSKDNI